MIKQSSATVGIKPLLFFVGLVFLQGCATGVLYCKSSLVHNLIRDADVICIGIVTNVARTHEHEEYNDRIFKTMLASIKIEEGIWNCGERLSIDVLFLKDDSGQPQTLSPYPELPDLSARATQYIFFLKQDLGSNHRYRLATFPHGGEWSALTLEEKSSAWQFILWMRDTDRKELAEPQQLSRGQIESYRTSVESYNSLLNLLDQRGQVSAKGVACFRAYVERLKRCISVGEH
jgi:hypothetical protein